MITSAVSRLLGRQLLVASMKLVTPVMKDLRMKLPDARNSALLFLLLATTGFADSRIKRSQTAKAEFKLEHPCPANGAMKRPCPGYVIDHMWPLACGGEDHARNMQWQTVEDARAKDKWERKMCGGQ